MRMDELTSIVPHLAQGCITCVGDIMLDQFVYGAVERISPEAPIPVLRVVRETAVLGGLGNVARNLAALGAACHVISVVGNDSVGLQVRGLLGELDGCHAELLVNPTGATTVKTRCIAGNQQIVRVDREHAFEMTPHFTTQVLATTRQVAKNVLVISDYGKGVLTPEVTTALIGDARTAGKTVIVDPKGSDYRRYRGASIITPNRLELAQATRMPAASDSEVIAAARYLIETCEIDVVLATLSEHGMLLVHKDGTAEHLAAEAREVYDVSGAGDTVVATLAAALAVGTPLLQAARLANTAAGIVVGKVGTATASAAELMHTLRKQGAHSAEDKIVARAEAAQIVEDWRQKGLRIGFTNGCFDLLHPGHVTLLAQARQKVDRLVVGLNSDDSVSRLKGPQRPIQAEFARATVLASLQSVDLLVIFGEDTPRELIEALRPAVLIKGGDYTTETVVGADFVQSYGGEVVLIDLVAQHSTTRLVNRMLRAA